MVFDIPVPCFFPNTDFCEAIKKIGELGFSAAETYDWKNLDLDKVKYTCEETGVKLVSMCTSCFNLTDSSYRSEYLECLDESCKAAVKLGAGKLITQVGNDTLEEREVQHKNIVDTLKESVTILEEYGITLMIEPLNVIFDHKGYYLSSSSEAFDIIHEVDSDFVKVVFDIYHQQITEGNIIPNITNNLDCIAHLHCAGHPGRHDLQFGENDYNVIFEAVKESGYSGFCGLEYSPLSSAEESLEEFKKIYLRG